MAGTIYYNTKTTNTTELTQEEFKNLQPSIKAKYRKAVDSEIELHEARKGKKAVKDANYKKRVKAQDKEASKKEKIKAAAKVEADKGSTDTPTSEASK